MEMARHLCAFAVIGALFATISGTGPVLAQKAGGVLKIYHRDSPASMSILEEATQLDRDPDDGRLQQSRPLQAGRGAEQPANDRPGSGHRLVVERRRLTFRLRKGVKWHDGHPFTANDVKCTWELLLGRSQEKLRANPRKAWYQNLEGVTADGDFTATFHLQRPQPAIIALLASGYAPVYPCHVSPRDMRQHPIGTGPFKFVEFKPNEGIKLARNPDYWKSGRPYLDGIEYTIIPNRSTAILAFVAGKFDMTWPYVLTVPLLRDVQTQAPQAICEIKPMNGRANLLVTDAPPFDNPVLRRAMQLSLDRKSFIDILGEGQYDIGAVLQPPPEGIWGMPLEILEEPTGHGMDIQKNREDARGKMPSLG